MSGQGRSDIRAALDRLLAADERERDVRIARKRDLWSAFSCGVALVLLAGLAVGILAVAVVGWRLLLGGLP